MARNKYVLNATSLSKSRSSWIQSKSHKTSIPFGKVVPLGAPIEILPGDSFGLDMGAVIRSLTPKAPLMDSISGDIYAYFVPHRLVFDKTKEFFGQNESEAWTLNLSYQIPCCKNKLYQSAYTANGTTGFYYYTGSGGTTDLRGTLFDHFEMPVVYLNSSQYSSLPASTITDDNFVFNMLPFRGYQLIWNEDFRNPSVVDPDLVFNYDHSDISGIGTYMAGWTLKPVMRYRDLFSSALKAPQRGPSVTLPLGTIAPLVATDSYRQMTQQIGGVNYKASFRNSENTPVVSSALALDSNGYLSTETSVTPTGTSNMNYTNLAADLSSASAATINLIRQSVALQHLYEMMSNAFRYQEYTEVFFGVRGADSTLQRPQHLGGIHFRFNINEVIATSETSASKLGQTGAFGTAEIKGHVYTQSFTEHGYVYLLVVLRKEHTYVQGLDKLWRKRDFLDIFQPPLAHIGNVDIKQSEIWFGFNADGSLDDSAFGYTEPYYEYRYQVSKACGLMNPMAPNSLSFYSLTDVISSKPSLNKAFVSEDPNGLDNALMASATYVDQFYGDFYFRYKCSRVMPLYSIPGLTRI